MTLSLRSRPGCLARWPPRSSATAHSRGLGRLLGGGASSAAVAERQWPV